MALLQPIRFLCLRLTAGEKLSKEQLASEAAMGFVPLGCGVHPGSLLLVVCQPVAYRVNES